MQWQKKAKIEPQDSQNCCQQGLVKRFSERAEGIGPGLTECILPLDELGQRQNMTDEDNETEQHRGKKEIDFSVTP